MAKKEPEPTQLPPERAFLVGVEIRETEHFLSLEDSLDELALLADTAGLSIVGKTTQRLDQPNTVTYIGSGKVEEVKLLADETCAEVIIFDNELSPRHQRELEKAFGDAVRIIDRTALILDIFGQHATSSDGKLQVELAQYEYILPRLTRAWTHLARQSGGASGRTGSVGGVGLRGPGETQLEVDRREIHKRITHLKREIEKLRSHRMRTRAQRQKSRIPIVSLVGYTNAGKSTLLNRLGKTDVLTADKLFATLDPTTRRIQLSGDRSLLLTDTVGFIQKLPTQLVAAFKATLEELTESDLLLHIVDISHPNALAQYKSVLETLREIGAEEIPTLTVLNKNDKLQVREEVMTIPEEFDGAILISALQGKGIDILLGQIEVELYESFMPLTVKIPYQEGNYISLFHQEGHVERAEHGSGGVTLQGSVPKHLFHRFTRFLKNELAD